MMENVKTGHLLAITNVFMQTGNFNATLNVKSMNHRTCATTAALILLNPVMEIVQILDTLIAMEFVLGMVKQPGNVMGSVLTGLHLVKENVFMNCGISIVLANARENNQYTTAATHAKQWTFHAIRNVLEVNGICTNKINAYVFAICYCQSCLLKWDQQHLN